MLRQLLSASAVGLTLIAAPAMAQNYNQNYGQRYDNGYQQPMQQNGYNRSNNAYGNQGYQNNSGYNNSGNSGYGNNGYGNNTRGSNYSPADRSERRQERQQSRENLAVDVDNALQKHGYDVGQVDGKSDAKSRAAIRAYQRDANLPVTGEPSQDLLAHIEANDVRPGGATTLGATVDRFLGDKLGR